MKQYLLDTNICIYALKRQHGVDGRLVAHPRASIHVSIITVAEMRFGVTKSSAATKAARLLGNFLAPLQIIDFTDEDARAYAIVRSRLERTGKPIGALDMLIASQGLSRGFTVVTNNEGEFSRVTGLRIENWAG